MVHGKVKLYCCILFHLDIKMYRVRDGSGDSEKIETVIVLSRILHCVFLGSYESKQSAPAPASTQLSVAATPVQCDPDNNICSRFSQEKLEIVILDNDKLLVFNLDIIFKHFKKAPKVYGR